MQSLNAQEKKIKFWFSLIALILDVKWIKQRDGSFFYEMDQTIDIV